MLEKNKIKGILCTLLFLGVVLITGCGERGNSTTQTNQHQDSTSTTSQNDKTDTNPADTNTGVQEEAPVSFVEINSQTEEFVYSSQDDIDLLRAGHRCVTDGENIYLAYNEPDLYVMTVGEDTHRPVNLENPDGMMVCQVTTDRSGNVHVLAADKDYKSWYIWQLNSEYGVEKIIDISSYFDTKIIPVWFLVDQKGNYFFQLPYNRNGVILDSAGNLLYSTSPESLGLSWIYEAGVGRDGNINLVYSTDSGQMEIGVLDTQTGAFQKGDMGLSMQEGETFQAMYAGTDTDLLLYSPYSGIWAYDRTTSVFENRVPLPEMGFDPGREYFPMTFLKDGRLLLIGCPLNSGDVDTNGCILRYVPAGK